MRWRSVLRKLSPFVAVALLTVVPIEASAQSKSDVNKAREEKERAYAELVEANERVGSAIARLEEIADQLYDLHRRVERLESRIVDYRDTVDGLEAEAQDLVVEAYMSGGGNLLSAAFEAGSIQDLLTSQLLIDKATSYDLVSLDRLAAVSREMERLTVDLEERQVEIKALEEEQAAVVEELAEAQAKAEAVFNKANSKYRDVYARWREAQRRAAAAAAARRNGAAAGLPSSTTKGVVCPVAGPTWFTDTWGAPRSGGRTHKGTDMAAAKGTPLVAMYSGTVRINTHYLGGRQVYVYGDNGVFYYYAHLSRWASGLSNGDRVKKGQVIGYVGNTGNATGYVLHLGMGPIGGGYVNPYPTVRAVC